MGRRGRRMVGLYVWKRREEEEEEEEEDEEEEEEEEEEDEEEQRTVINDVNIFHTLTHTRI